MSEAAVPAEAVGVEKGHLRRAGFKPYGAYWRYMFWSCMSCGTLYPEIRGRISCNGAGISRCLCAEGG